MPDGDNFIFDHISSMVLLAFKCLAKYKGNKGNYYKLPLQAYIVKVWYS